MTPASTESLRALIDRQLFPLDAAVPAEADLYAEGLDSMALMQLILLLERDYGIAITPDDLGRENFATLASLAAFVSRKQTATSFFNREWTPTPANEDKKWQ